MYCSTVDFFNDLMTLLFITKNYELLLFYCANESEVCLFHVFYSGTAISVLMLLVRQQEEHPARRKLSDEDCWHGCVSGARCKSPLCCLTLRTHHQNCFITVSCFGY